MVSRSQGTRGDTMIMFDRPGVKIRPGQVGGRIDLRGPSIAPSMVSRSRGTRGDTMKLPGRLGVRTAPSRLNL
ncbi:hypothetical protein LINPERHAP1_LOCUS8990 [Linum perenne]